VIVTTRSGEYPSAGRTDRIRFQNFSRIGLAITLAWSDCAC
jgi:hypothetical protein